MQHPDEGTIHAWLDGALSPAEARAFEDHVAGCAECEAAVAAARGLLAATSRILSALDNVPAGVVPTSAGTLAELVARSSRDTNAPGRFRATRWRAAAALVVVAGTSWLVLHPRSRSVSDVPASEQKAVAVAADSAIKTPPPQVAAVVPQSTQPAAPSALSSAQSSASTAKRNMAPRTTQSVASRGDSLPSRRHVGFSADEQSRVAQKQVPSANANESRSSAAPRVAAEAMAPARDAAAGNVATTDMMERRAQSLAKADVRALRQETQSAEKDQAAIDSVLAVDSARGTQSYATLGAASGGSAAKMRGATSAPSVQAPLPPASRLLDASSIIDRAAGCYAIETTGWIPDDQPDRGTPSLLPARIELQRAIGLSGDERGNRLARPAPGEPGLSPGVIGFWKPLAGDRIRVTFADDTSWVALTLAVAPESVRGPARTYSASSGRLRSTEVEARRVPCR
jgi:anti-sigma factor RsiW